MQHQEPGSTPAALKDQPTWLISRAFARSSALLSAGFEAHGNGLRGYHYRLLTALEEWGPTSQADLSRSTGIDPSDVTAALADLEAETLIDRVPDPAHKRRNIVSLTPAGVRRLRRLDAVVRAVQNEVLAPLTPTQQRQFLALLARLGPE